MAEVKNGMTRWIRNPFVGPGRGDVWALALLFIAVTARPGSAALIPEDRRIEWAPGIPGGIPTNYPVFCNVRVKIPGSPLVAVGDGKADDYPALAAAIQWCPAKHVIYLPEGVYRISTGLWLADSVVLRGAGQGKTRIVLDSAYRSPVVGIGQGVRFSRPLPIELGFYKNSRLLGFRDIWTITPVREGDLLAVTQHNDPELVYPHGMTWGGLTGHNQLMSQIMGVAGKSENNLILARPLYVTFKRSQNPLAYRMRGFTFSAGLESCTLETAKYVSAANSVQLSGTVHCWVKDVEVYHSAKSFIWMTMSYGNEVRQCFVHEPWDNEGGSGYGYHIFGPNSDHLVEDNIAWQCRHSMVLEGGGSGCVFGYNYSADAWSSVSPGWVYNDLICHGAHPYMNLYEGNSLHKWSQDYVHGSSSHNTGFRNQITAGGEPTEYPYDRGFWAVSIESCNYFMNVVGNVLGWPGVTTRYEFVSPGQCVYKIGYGGEGDTVLEDTKCAASAIRHGNYDFANKAVVWDPSIPDHVLPQSLYLKGKPSFFGELPWPWVGPDLEPMVKTLPAHVRFDAWRKANPAKRP